MLKALASTRGMTGKITKSWMLLLLLSGLWAGSASAAMVDGVTVEGIGSETTTGVAGDPVEYFIPLKRRTSGVYGAASDFDGTSSCAAGTATRSDSGYGFGYDNADALTMNIFFDLATIPATGTAQLNFWFADLDLQGIPIRPRILQCISRRSRPRRSQMCGKSQNSPVHAF